jgi:hypothetical protein
LATRTIADQDYTHNTIDVIAAIAHKHTKGDAGKSRWQWNSRVKGLPRIGFLGERFYAVEFGGGIELPFPSRTVEWLITARPCTALKVRAASTLLPTLFPSSTGSRLSPSSSH